jgi:hypothetical protein
MNLSTKEKHRQPSLKVGISTFKKNSLKAGKSEKLKFLKVGISRAGYSKPIFDVSSRTKPGITCP